MDDAYTGPIAKSRGGTFTWSTPVLIEEPIAEITAHVFAAGIDNYEASNPVNYGVPAS